MNGSSQGGSLMTSFVNRVAPAVSLEARKLVALGRHRGWNCTVLGQAPIPKEPVRYGDWLIIPAHQDSSTVPPQAQERVQAVFAAGIRPEAFMVVHEAPKLLAAPAGNQERSWRISPMPSRLTTTLKVTAGALGVVGGIVAVSGLAVLAVAVLAVAAALVLPALLVVGAAGVAVLDPILVAVTEDGWWIELMRWQD